MGQVLHGSHYDCGGPSSDTAWSREPEGLAKRYGINHKIVARWKRRSSTADLPTGPKDRVSTVLSVEDEAVIVAFRRHPLLPLDDCLYALEATIPHLTRSSLHRCLQRHDISRLPTSRVTSQTGGRSRPTRSAPFISTSPRSRPQKARATSMSPSTAPASSPCCSWSRRPAGPPPPPS